MKTPCESSNGPAKTLSPKRLLLHNGMKKVTILKTASALILVVMLPARELLGQTQGQTYQVIDLGTLGGTNSRALGINASGQVVGYALTSGNYEHAFLYSNGSMQDLGTLGGSTSRAAGINDYGQVVGWSSTSDYHTRAFLYSGGSMQDLGTFGGSWTFSYANGINNCGQIVGYIEDQTCVNPTGDCSKSCLFANGSIQYLGSLPSLNSNTIATSINASGQIVGYATVHNNTNGDFVDAFLYSNGLMQDIGTFATNNPCQSWTQANGINDSGQVVGFWNTNCSGSVTHAFWYSNGSMQDLGTFGGTGGSYAYGINNRGQIVGWSFVSSWAQHAFVYLNSHMYDLNDFVVIPASGWTLQQAHAINDAGQIVGWGTNLLGQTHALLLNPLPFGWKNKITAQPPNPVYGNCPVKDPTKANLILITHGAIPPWEDPETSTGWVDSMTNPISQYLTAHGFNDWQVVGYKWIDKAKFSIIPGTPNYGPEQTLVYASEEGNKLGKGLKNEGWTHIHLISHSAGAALIQAVTDAIKPSTTTVHSTFLDPFVGLKLEYKNVYGNNADWSDQYFSYDLETGGNLYALTQSLLNYAYNVDVTQLNKVRDYGAFVSDGNGVTEPCMRTVTSHGWPIQFYMNTVTGNINSQYEGVGFPLSKEGGDWNQTVANYTRGNQPPKILGTPDDNCVSFSSVDPQTMLNVAVSQSPSALSGDIVQYPYGLKGTTHSPSWIAVAINATNVMNFVSFDSQFLSTNAQGLLSVYWDANTIGSLDEEAVESGVQHYTFTFTPTTTGSTHMLGFRIDPVTNMQSVVLVTNISLGTMGPSQPFTLSATTNTVGGLRVFELTGQSGFNYTVETSTNLADWETIAALVNTNGAVRFFDRSATNSDQRYYRAVAPYQLAH